MTGLREGMAPLIQQAAGSNKMTAGVAMNETGVAPTATAKKSYAEQTDSELAELATQEISLDLQGLIDDTQFPDDNLFGDLMETAKKNDSSQQWMSMARGATPSSGSSGQNSPGSEGQNSPPAYGNGGAYGGRNMLAYLPGSVHNAGYNPYNNHQQQQQQHQQHQQQQPQQHHHNQNVQVKQEPLETEYSSCSVAGTPGSNQYALPNSYPNQASSTPQQTPAPVLPFNLGGPLPNLKSFAQQPKYLLPKKKGDKSTDEYRRRRERNNVAVRKSREKAKIRTRDTEERVKILARENDRMSKKVELLQEELGVLRSLFSSVGVLPDNVHRELAKHLDNFQAQHAAINY